MNISYDWLREFTELPLGPRELAERLTVIGLAVDAVHEVGDDFVLEIDLTSNRPDCLSHLGVAREVAAALGTELRMPDVRAPRAGGATRDFASVEILDVDLCPRYAARVVRGVKIAPSPTWLANRLQAIGQRPINNVADVTNFVLHELGQPLHAFDLATLEGPRIVVRRALPSERIRTLDGTVRELDTEMLVIADASRAVAVAGVMGGEETEISEATTDVLIESAYFSPASVRRTSKVLGLSTEASYRFERGVDHEGVRRAQDRCVALICEIAGGTATEDALDVYPEPLPARMVTLRPRRVEALTSLSVTAEESRRILVSLGFELRDGGGASPASNESALSFAVPSWRVDVELEEDLVEEVARHAGYDKMKEALPASSMAGEYGAGEQRRRAVRSSLKFAGFDEAINFSFINSSHDGQFELLPGLTGAEGSEAFVTLDNPVIEGVVRMRPTLLPGLLGDVRHNLNHGTRDVRLFEFGRVFAAGPSGGGLPTELESFALVLTGVAQEEGRAAPTRELDFYDLKGTLETAADAMNLGALRFERADVLHLRRGQSARVLLGKEPVGTLGRLSEEVASAYKFRQPVYVAEVNFAALLEEGEEPVRYAPLPRFPSVVRDASLLVSRRVTFDELRRAVTGLGIETLRGASLYDVYEGANLPEGKRSITLRVEYRADERTLRDEEVDEAHARVVRLLEESFGAQLRA